MFNLIAPFQKNKKCTAKNINTQQVQNGNQIRFYIHSINEVNNQKRPEKNEKNGNRFYRKLTRHPNIKKGCEYGCIQ